MRIRENCLPVPLAHGLRTKNAANALLPKNLCEWVGGQVRAFRTVWFGEMTPRLGKVFDAHSVYEYRKTSPVG